MNTQLTRALWLIGGIALIGLTTIWGGTMPQAVSATAAPSAAAAPAPGLPAQGFADVAQAVTPAVVNIVASRPQGRDPREQMQEFFNFPFPFGPQGPKEFRGPRAPHDAPEPHGSGQGSGVIVTPDGYVLTNNHVVDSAKELTVTLPDKREFKGKIVGTDPKTDLAVVKIDGRDLPYVPWGDSARLRVGDYVLAVGNPFGLNSTVTLGIVSALGRGRMGITQYEDFIQTDAAINPGNSGGALVNTKGELVGINTAIFSRSGGNEGVGFAVPTSLGKTVFESLARTGKVVRGYLGVGIQDVTKELAKSFGLKEAKGALVSDVNENSPAEQGGLKSGDIIMSYQGSPVSDGVTLQRLVAKTPIGTKATVGVIRDGRDKDIAITVGELPEPAKIAKADGGAGEQALAGVAVQDLDRETARELGLAGKIRGVVVVSVEPDSGVEQAGLQPGDVIREINRQPVKSVKDYEKAASHLKKGDQVLMLINRRGASLFLSAKV
ncbi:MAG TPA: DegQ family serine endoprotease [Nitrospiraceae bacterium]|nr:DegQ family serine endoprotease [Nitrospiraceae bacterium]